MQSDVVHRGCQLLSRNVERFRGGLVFKALRLLHHSTLGSKVIRKKRRRPCAHGRHSFAQLRPHPPHQAAHTLNPRPSTPHPSTPCPPVPLIQPSGGWGLISLIHPTRYPTPSTYSRTAAEQKCGAVPRRARI